MPTGPITMFPWLPQGRVDKKVLLMYVDDIAPPSNLTNWALASNGGVATAQSTYPPYMPSQAIDGVPYAGVALTDNMTWGASVAGPQWWQVTFAATRTISVIEIFLNQYNGGAANTGAGFNIYGPTAWTADYWNGSSWVNIPEMTRTGNGYAYVRQTISPVTTTAIRVNFTASGDGYMRIAQFCAFGT